MLSVVTMKMKVKTESPKTFKEAHKTWPVYVQTNNLTDMWGQYDGKNRRTTMDEYGRLHEIFKGRDGKTYVKDADYGHPYEFTGKESETTCSNKSTEDFLGFNGAYAFMGKGLSDDNLDEFIKNHKPWKTYKSRPDNHPWMI